MIVYFIYKHGGQLHPYLYAITNKKKIKDSFFKERKESLFIVKEKDIEKNDFNKICLDHGQYILRRRGYETKSSSSFNSERNIIYLTSTLQEEISIVELEDKVYLYLEKFIDEEARYFNSELIKALNEIMYFDIDRYVNNLYGDNNDYFYDGSNFYVSRKFPLDSFSVFMLLFGNTIDKEGILK